MGTDSEQPIERNIYCTVCSIVNVDYADGMHTYEWIHYIGLEIHDHRWANWSVCETKSSKR